MYNFFLLFFNISRLLEIDRGKTEYEAENNGNEIYRQVDEEDLDGQTQAHKFIYILQFILLLLLYPMTCFE
jgi:hypothetical protein